MIEREIFQIIEAGLTYLKNTPGAVASFFQKTAIGMDEVESQKVEAWFRATPPSVEHGYPRAGAKFPLYSITLGNDSEDTTFLGNDGGQVDALGDEDNGADIFAALWGQSINITVYALNPDAVLYCYHLLKQMLVNGIPELQGEPWCLYNIRITAADMAPDKVMEPAVMFIRRVTMSFAYQYTQAWPASKVDRVTSVEGINIDAAGDDGADVGGVPTLVTVKGS